MSVTSGASRAEQGWFWFLLVLALAARVYGAWCFRHLADADAAVAGLMSRHMAEGLGFPTFFYGQAYMGSLEPAVGALFCRLLGGSGLAVCLGTAAVAFFIPLVVYAWARELGGRKAGLAAMAFAVLGPAGYYPYLCQPRGGYAVIVLASALTLWLAGRIVAREREGRRVAWSWYLALGLAAGAGWWTSGLTAAALAAAALLFVIFMPRRLLSGRIAAGLAGFVIGSAPFWVWNARHGNAALAYLLGGVGRSTPLAHLKLFVAERVPMVLGLSGAPAWPMIAVAAVLAALAAGGVVSLAVQGRRRQGRATVHLAGMLLFAMIWLVLFCRSSFADLATPRYLTPLVPALAVLVGVAVAGSRRRAVFLSAAAGLAVVLAAQTPALPGSWRKQARDEGMVRRVRNEDANIRRRCPGDDTFYNGYPYYWRNFATQAPFCFTPYTQERFQPFFERAEYRDAMATLGNFGGVREFLAVSGGAAEFPGPIVRGFSPPSLNVEEVPPDGFASIVGASQGGQNLNAIMTDGHLDTYWRRPVAGAGRQSDRLEVVFREPVEIAGLRLISRSLVFPAWVRVEAWAPGADEPVEIVPENRVPGLFWSGPRPFWQGRYYRLECRWRPMLAARLRLRLADDRSTIWRLSELQVFRVVPNAAWPSEKEALPDLLRLLEARGIERLYGDRWAANAVHRETGGRVFTEREGGPEDILAGADPNPLRRNWVRLTPQTALLALVRDAPLCRRSLAARGVAMRETWLGPWVLFDFAPANWRVEYGDFQGLTWAGYGCLRTDDEGAALALLVRARALHDEVKDVPAALRLLERAVSYAPDLKPALRDLAAWLPEAGRADEARAFAERAEKAWRPDLPAPAFFPKGVEFLGLSVSSTNAAPGACLEFRYYWRHPPSRSVTAGLLVFVHVKDSSGNLVFQDDHALLNGVEVERQPEPLVFVETRSVTVPARIEPGDYTVWLGLYPSGSGRRWACRTDLPSDRRALRLPLVLRVAAP